MKVFVSVISGDISNGSFQGPCRGEDMSVGNCVENVVISGDISVIPGEGK